MFEGLSLRKPLAVTTQLTNPSTFGVEIGTLAVGLYYEDLYLGHVALAQIFRRNKLAKTTLQACAKFHPVQSHHRCQPYQPRRTNDSLHERLRRARQTLDGL